MQIVVGGGGMTSEFLMTTMLDRGYRITVIEQDHDIVEHLSEVLPSQILIVEGDGCDSEVQLDAGMDDADLFVALMGHDDTNLVACEIAMASFDIPRCIANVNSPKNERIFEEVGIEAVSSTELIARMIDEEATIGDIRSIFPLLEGDIVLMTLRLPDSLQGRKSIPAGAIAHSEDTCHAVKIIGVVRGDDIEMVNDNTELLPGETFTSAVRSAVTEEFRAEVKRL